MTPSLTLTGSGAAAAAFTRAVKAARGSLFVAPLTESDRDEALSFLSARPLHTVIMAGHILENGVASALNRGAFYGCRDRSGELQGVALIGHATMFEVRSREALKMLARMAKTCPSVRTIIGETESARKFWNEYKQRGQVARLLSRTLLYERSEPVNDYEPVEGLRMATPDDLPLIVPAHAQLVMEGMGVNPLETDPEGFLHRCARRVERRRVWVWIENGRLIFKADLMADTPQAAYLEGVFIDCAWRGKGYGRRCFSQLTNMLLAPGRAVCGFVDAENGAARAFYERTGHTALNPFEKILL